MRRLGWPAPSMMRGGMPGRRGDDGVDCGAALRARSCRGRSSRCASGWCCRSSQAAAGVTRVTGWRRLCTAERATRPCTLQRQANAAGAHGLARGNFRHAKRERTDARCLFNPLQSTRRRWSFLVQPCPSAANTAWIGSCSRKVLAALAVPRLVANDANWTAGLTL